MQGYSTYLDVNKNPPKGGRIFHLVEQRGLEPRTPCLQSRCSSQLSYCPKYIFNELLVRKLRSRSATPQSIILQTSLKSDTLPCEVPQALLTPAGKAGATNCQLSYCRNSYVVGDPGLEPGTSSLSVTRSNQLS